MNLILSIIAAFVLYLGVAFLMVYLREKKLMNFSWGLFGIIIMIGFYFTLRVNTILIAIVITSIHGIFILGFYWLFTKYKVLKFLKIQKK